MRVEWSDLARDDLIGKVSAAELERMIVDDIPCEKTQVVGPS